MTVYSPIFDKGRGYQDGGANFRAHKRAVEFVEACDLAWRLGAREFSEYPTYPTGSRSGGYEVADVTFHLQSMLETDFTATSDGRADPATFPQEFADRFHDRMVPIVTEERQSFTDARDLQNVPTRLPSMFDLTREQLDSGAQALQDGRAPSWVDDPTIPLAVRQDYWKSIPIEIRRDHMYENAVALVDPETDEMGDVLEAPDLNAAIPTYDKEYADDDAEGGE